MKRLWPLLLVSILATLWLWPRASVRRGSADRPAPERAAADPTSAPPRSIPASDFRAELELARGLADRRLRAREWERVLRLWLERDPDAALAGVRSLRLANQFPQGMLVVLEALGPRDADRALAFAAELALPREKRSFYSSLFERLARENITLALPRLAMVPEGEDRTFAVRALTAAWAQTDFTAAFAWGQTQPEADRVIALEAALLHLAGQDPMQTIELAQKNLAGPGLDRVALSAFEKLSATDPETAAALVGLLPPGEVHFQAALGAARGLGEKNPAAATTWIKTLPPGELQQHALNGVLLGWTRKDPSAAAHFVAIMPAGAEQHAAATFLATSLGALAPDAALAWARKLPAADTRSAALSHVVSAWAMNRPAEAVAWAFGQSDLPPEALHGAFFQWQRAQTVVAEAWLDAVDLPRERKAALRGPRPAGVWAGLP